MRIILDVDTGVDDALAILYALGRTDIQLDALTTIYGNLDVESTTRNTIQLLEMAGRADIPVAKGVSRPLTQPFNGDAPHVHGASGFGDVVMPDPVTKPVEIWAPDLLITLCASDRCSHVCVSQSHRFSTLVKEQSTDDTHRI